MGRKLSPRIFLLFLLAASSVGPLQPESLPFFSLKEKEARTFFKRGLAYYNKGEFAAARENFLKSLSLKPDFPHAKFFLSETYYLSGDWQESLAELEQLESSGKLNLIRKSRLDALRFQLGGSNRKDTLEYYKSVNGDDLRRFRFRNPTDVAVDEEGYLYVTSFETANIVKFDANGNPVDNFKGSLGRNLQGPTAIAVRGKSIFVADYAGDTIYEFNTHGDYVNRFGNTGKQPGYFHGPSGIFLTREGYLFVSDMGNDRIQKVAKDGSFLQEIGKGILRQPAGLKINSKGEIFVADKGNRRIVVFDKEGNYLKEITHPALKKPRNLTIRENKIYVADEAAGLFIYDSISKNWSNFESFRDSKNNVRNFDQAFGIGFDYTGTMFVTDFNRHRLDIFSPKGQLASNLDLLVERVISSNYPDISLVVQARDRHGAAVKAIPRNSFRVYEMDNLSPLIGLTNMQKYNNRVTVSIVAENSKQIAESYPLIEKALKPFLSEIRSEDKIQLLRSGKDTQVAYSFGKSMYDIFRAIRAFIPEEESQIGKSLQRGITDLLDSVGPRAVLAVVSGKDLKAGFTQFSPTKIIRFAVAHDIPIFFLCLGEEGESVQIYKEIAEKSGGKFLMIPGGGAEKSLRNWVESKKDRRYLLSFKSRIDSSGGEVYIPVVVEAVFRNSNGKAETGFFSP
ncbi:NHL repeat protein [Leptospira broomii serovar Hurstbridge str. 5399]|uniref:NHL repeat protein n=1 Tax=Leptospira broomii serovar Hurstbridge str. 5399 TaxID=1049789 RepID=T0EZ70_9LEPT|nr:tetratricopeptide repeat protein [Leptospira broomii]EQA44160.1 NHL repeat protein [Leptospira broomii serovar Hurstbridge str. 5399]